MANPPPHKPDWKELEQRLDRRVKCEDRVTFNSTLKEGCGGIVKTINQNGCLLVTIEHLRVGMELVIGLRLRIGDEEMPCEVSGKVVNVDKTVERPLNGYGVLFDPNNPQEVKTALREIVEAKRRPSAVPHTPPPAMTEAAPISQAPRQAEAVRVEPKSLGQSRASGGRFLVLGGILGLLVLIYGGIRILPRVIVPGSVKSLSLVIPLKDARLNDANLLAKIPRSWLQNTPTEVKRVQLNAFGREMRKQRIYAADLRAEDGRQVAIVLVQTGSDSGELMVRFNEDVQ